MDANRSAQHGTKAASPAGAGAGMMLGTAGVSAAAASVGAGTSRQHLEHGPSCEVPPSPLDENRSAQHGTCRPERLD